VIPASFVTFGETQIRRFRRSFHAYHGRLANWPSGYGHFDDLLVLCGYTRLRRYMTTLDSGDQAIFEEAYRQARTSLDEHGIPIGAALGLDGTLIASGHNERVQNGDPIAHGEIACLRNAGRRRDYRQMTLFTTLAPCDMCTGAILLFGIPRVVVGEAQTFPGMLDYLISRGVAVTLLNDDRCVALMREFQQRFPEVWREDIGD